MALPSLSKTWRFAHDSTPPGVSASESQRYVWWAIFNALRGKKPDDSAVLDWKDSAGAAASAPTVLWTVPLSSDAITAGAGNNITSFSDIVHVNSGYNSGAHTWAVLDNTAVGIQLKMSLQSGSFSGNPGQLDSQCFQTAITAFSGGTTTVDPTSTNAGNCWSSGINTNSASNNQAWMGNPAGPVGHKIHTWASTDGKCWRIVVFRGGYSVFTLIIDVPQSPVTLLGTPNKVWNGAEKPYWAWIQGAPSDGAISRANKWEHWTCGTSNGARGRTNLGTFVNTALNDSKQLMLTGEAGIQSNQSMSAATALGAIVRQGLSSFTNKYPLTPIGLAGIDPSYYGRCGVVSDIWWGTDTDQGVAEGDNYPDDLTRQFVQVGALAFPWDGSVMATS